MRTQIEIDLLVLDGKETSNMNGRPPHLVLRDGPATRISRAGGGGRAAVVLEQGDHSMVVPFDELEAAVRALGVVIRKE